MSLHATADILEDHNPYGNFLADVKVGEWLILMYYHGIIFVLRTKSFTTYVANQYIEHKVQISDSNFSELLPSP